MRSFASHAQPYQGRSFIPYHRKFFASIINDAESFFEVEKNWRERKLVKKNDRPQYKGFDHSIGSIVFVRRGRLFHKEILARFAGTRPFVNGLLYTLKYILREKTFAGKFIDASLCVGNFRDSFGFNTVFI